MKYSVFSDKLEGGTMESPDSKTTSTSGVGGNRFQKGASRIRNKKKVEMYKRHILKGGGDQQPEPSPGDNGEADKKDDGGDDKIHVGQADKNDFAGADKNDDAGADNNNDDDNIQQENTPAKKSVLGSHSLSSVEQDSVPTTTSTTHPSKKGKTISVLSMPSMEDMKKRKKKEEMVKKKLKKVPTKETTAAGNNKTPPPSATEEPTTAKDAPKKKPAAATGSEAKETTTKANDSSTGIGTAARTSRRLRRISIPSLEDIKKQKNDDNNTKTNNSITSIKAVPVPAREVTPRRRRLTNHGLKIVKQRAESRTIGLSGSGSKSETDNNDDDQDNNNKNSKTDDTNQDEAVKKSTSTGDDSSTKAPNDVSVVNADDVKSIVKAKDSLPMETDDCCAAVVEVIGMGDDYDEILPPSSKLIENHPTKKKQTEDKADSSLKKKHEDVIMSPNNEDDKDRALEKPEVNVAQSQSVATKMHESPNVEDPPLELVESEASFDMGRDHDDNAETLPLFDANHKADTIKVGDEVAEKDKPPEKSEVNMLNANENKETIDNEDEEIFTPQPSSFEIPDTSYYEDPALECVDVDSEVMVDMNGEEGAAKGDVNVDEKMPEENLEIQNPCNELQETDGTPLNDPPAAETFTLDIPDVSYYEDPSFEIIEKVRFSLSNDEEEGKEGGIGRGENVPEESIEVVQSPKNEEEIIVESTQNGYDEEDMPDKMTAESHGIMSPPPPPASIGASTQEESQTLPPPPSLIASPQVYIRSMLQSESHQVDSQQLPPPRSFIEPPQVDSQPLPPTPAIVDPEWDTCNVHFQAVEEPKKDRSNDGLGMFETGSWARTDASFSKMPGAHPDIEAMAQKLMQIDENADATSPTVAMLRAAAKAEEEEKKERDIASPERKDTADSIAFASNQYFQSETDDADLYTNTEENKKEDILNSQLKNGVDDVDDLAGALSTEELHRASSLNAPESMNAVEDGSAENTKKEIVNSLMHNQSEDVDDMDWAFSTEELQIKPDDVNLSVNTAEDCFEKNTKNESLNPPIQNESDDVGDLAWAFSTEELQIKASYISSPLSAATGDIDEATKDENANNPLQNQSEDVNDLSWALSTEELQSKAPEVTLTMNTAENINVEDSTKKGIVNASIQSQSNDDDDSAWAVSTQIKNADTSSPTNGKATNMFGAPDMFDTSSWAHTDVAFSDVSLSKLMHHPDIEAKCNSLVHEDSKQDQQDVAADKTMEQIITDEEGKTPPVHSTKSVSEEKVDLHDGEQSAKRSSYSDKDEEEVESSLYAMKERIHTYTSLNIGDDASSNEDNDAVSEDSKSQGEADVSYSKTVSETNHNLDESDLPVEVDSPEKQLAETTTSTIAEDIPTFEVADATAIDAQKPNESDVHDEMDSQKQPGDFEDSAIAENVPTSGVTAVREPQILEDSEMHCEMDPPERSITAMIEENVPTFNVKNAAAPEVPEAQTHDQPDVPAKSDSPEKEGGRTIATMLDWPADGAPVSAQDAQNLDESMTVNVAEDVQTPDESNIPDEAVSLEQVEGTATTTTSYAGKGLIQMMEGLQFVKHHDSGSDEQDGSTTEAGSNTVGSVVSSLVGEYFVSGASLDGSINKTSVDDSINKPGKSHPPRIPPGALSGVLPPPPPPPTPPPQKKKSRRSKSGQKAGTSESRRRPKQLESVDESKAEEPTNSPGKNNQIDEPPEVQRQTSSGGGPTLFGSPNRAKISKSPEKALSPNDGHLIISDQKMAEKVALASSAAAVKFEQRLKLEEEQSPTKQIPNFESEILESQSPVGVTSPVQFGDPDADDNAIVDYQSPRSPKDVNLVGSGLELVGGAFSSWKDSDFERNDAFPISIDAAHSVEKKPLEESSSDEKPPEKESEKQTDDEAGFPNNNVESIGPLAWFCKVVLGSNSVVSDRKEDLPIICRLLLEDDSNFNRMCEHLADTINTSNIEMDVFSFDERTISSVESFKTSFTSVSADSVESSKHARASKLRPMALSDESRKLPPNIVAANFVSFLFLASKFSSAPSPFGDDNPFLADIVSLSLDGGQKALQAKQPKSTPQEIIFEHPKGQPEVIIEFVYDACMACQNQTEEAAEDAEEADDLASPSRDISSKPDETSCAATPAASNRTERVNRLLIVPESHPSPFESSVWNSPRILAVVLSFLGDPVAVCRTKMVSRFCRRIISENEHMLMQQAVRVGGLSMNVRPAFWMWVTLQKCGDSKQGVANLDIRALEEKGRTGKWHSVIERDVARAFGNMPPHKTGARLRTDSIVKALVTWGKNRIMTRGVKGGGDPVRTPELGPKQDRKVKDFRRRISTSSPPWESVEGTDSVNSDASQTPTETVSDWGGVSPVGSFTGSHSGFSEGDTTRIRGSRAANPGQDALPAEELALSGNSLSNDMKVDLQNKLRFILHSLAAAHEDVGYCQGMDYVVAHLLRILQDTVRWKAVQRTLPPAITGASDLPDLSKLQEEGPIRIAEEVDKSCVVEEVVFRVMDTFFTTYNLRHMYWPELRCLKTCCRVFERLIQLKLPVLADHFEHHELNVGLFALGWFQTLFLYLPSMPSATVCHMWDIWLVERSLKIFFRVGTAILFLSQPILLNHELEGMMTYLNTIPDATLLKPDILIACALNIKVTNRLLQELEEEVTGGNEI